MVELTTAQSPMLNVNMEWENNLDLERDSEATKARYVFTMMNYHARKIEKNLDKWLKII